MLTKESIPIAPPITEIPDYVWAPRYGRPSYLSGRPIKKPVDTSRQIPHPDAEAALLAAKKACRSCPGRWYGRTSSQADAAEFLVYEGIKVVERHVVGR